MSRSLSFQALPQPWMLQGAVRQVYDALTAQGDEARFVGGCVRDALLGRKINDIDIATPLPPGKVIELLTSAGIKNIPTGIEHGTVTAVVDGEPIEVTTLRRDVETFGRQARVAFTDNWQADAARRDLTMNALSCRLDGQVHDYFGGLDDLAGGRVRFVGDPRTRMKEDYLRVLRFFRFHANYAAGDPDPTAMTAAKASASQLAHLSGERLRQETLKLLAAARGPDTWARMLEAGIVAAYLPEATDQERLSLVARREAALRIVPAAIRRLAALLPGKTEALAVGTKLRLSRREQERLSGITAGPELLLELEPVAVRRLIYRHGNDLALDLLLVHADKDADLTEAAGVTQAWQAPRMPIGGKDLAELGLQPGAAMGRWLALAEAWWIAGDFQADRTACLTWLQAQMAIS